MERTYKTIEMILTTLLQHFDVALNRNRLASARKAAVARRWIRYSSDPCFPPWTYDMSEDKPAILKIGFFAFPMRENLAGHDSQCNLLLFYLPERKYPNMLQLRHSR